MEMQREEADALRRAKQRDAAKVAAMLAVIQAGGQAELTVTGVSMLPFLHPGRDSVILEAADPQRLRVGDIVFFTRDAEVYVLHRIRRILKDGSFQICGDRQAWTECILPEQILARVSGVRRSGGRVISCDRASWRMASALWFPTRPLRPALFSAALRLRGLRKREESLRS